jgi:hypothetical protein
MERKANENRNKKKSKKVKKNFNKNETGCKIDQGGKEKNQKYAKVLCRIDACSSQYCRN